MIKFSMLTRLVATAMLILALHASAQNDPALTAQLQSMTAGFQGKLSLYAHDLATGQTISIEADQPVPTASVIKLGILYTALEQIRAGRAHFGDHLTLRKEDQVPGSGVLLFFDTPLTLTLKDALTLMIAQSDNTASNLVIDHLGIKAIDDQLTSPSKIPGSIKRSTSQPKAPNPPINPSSD
jgi:beta-lactamase class A